MVDNTTALPEDEWAAIIRLVQGLGLRVVGVDRQANRLLVELPEQR